MVYKNQTGRTLWIDYLRSFVIVLVVAHHASLAYTTFAKFNSDAYILSTSPVVDSKRWVGLDIFVGFNDIFFMFLIFFISGLFVVRSIKKKGVTIFLKDRIKRLFIPFLLLGTIAMLIAYFPSYYIAHNSTNIIAYIIDFFTIEQWPVGPPWFIWVLFLYNLLFAGIYSIIKTPLESISSRFSALGSHPVILFTLFFVITWITYVPIAYNVGALIWTGWGPFDFQLSRIIAYFGFFILGAVTGNGDFNNTIFSPGSVFVTSWKFWVFLSLFLFTAITLNSWFHILENLALEHKLSGASAWMIYYSFYVASCVASCMAFITLFRSQIKKSRAWWNSLSDNAYLIYLLHYIFILWGQFILSSFNIPAFIKFSMVFIFALLASWAVSSWLRKIYSIRKYL